MHVFFGFAYLYFIFALFLRLILKYGKVREYASVKCRCLQIPEASDILELELQAGMRLAIMGVENPTQVLWGEQNVFFTTKSSLQLLS